MVDRNFFRRWSSTAIVWVAVALVVLLLLYFFRILFVFEVFQKGSTFLSDSLGLNDNLSRAILGLSLAPFLWCLGQAISPLPRESRLQGVAGLGAFVALYSTLAWWVASETYFDEGVPTRYYADTPEGREFFEEPGFHKKYGVPLLPVTPEVVASEEADAVPQEFGSLEAAGDLFDRVTGSPRVWYSTGPGGELNYYSAPGFDPQTQAKLKPVTLEVAAIHRAHLETADRKRQEMLAKERVAQEREDAARQQQARTAAMDRAKAERLLEAARLRALVRRVPIQVGASNTGVFVRSIGDDDEIECEKTLRGLSTGDVNVVSGIFGPAFSREHFDAAFSGGASWLRPTDVFEVVDWVLLSRATWECARDAQGQRLWLCKMLLESQAFDKASHAAKLSVSQRGVGLSEQAARLQACRDVGGSEELQAYIAGLSSP